MSGPMLNIQCSIVVGQQGISCVAKDRFDKIQIADQSSGYKEPNLHGLVLAVSGHTRSHQRANQERHPGLHPSAALHGKWKKQVLRGWCDCRVKEVHEYMLGYSPFIPSDWQATFGHMKGPLGCPAIGLGVVQNSVG